MSFENANFGPVDGAGFVYDIRRNPNIEQGLRQLPFVRYDELILPEIAECDMLRDVTVPVSRLVSSMRGMRNWAAQGAPLKQLEDGEMIESFEYAVQLAVSEAYKQAVRPIIVSPFLDNAGEIWGLVEGGTHRVMAAKIKGDESMHADLKWPRQGQPLMRYDGIVADTVTPEH